MWIYSKYSKKELYKKQKEYFNKKLKKGRTSIERIQDNNVAQNLCILTQRSNQADHAIMVLFAYIILNYEKNVFHFRIIYSFL